VSTTRLRLHVGIIFVGLIRPEKGRKGGGGDAEETPDECDLLPPSGHSWARAGQVQSAGDQRKFQQNSQKYPGIVGFCLSINNDYGLRSILKSLVETDLTNTTSQNKNTCKSRALSGLLVEQAGSDRYLVSELAQASRHRIAEFSQVPPAHTISQIFEMVCGSTHFIAVIIGGGPGE